MGFHGTYSNAIGKGMGKGANSHHVSRSKYLLDKFPNAYAAWSVRKLNNSYTGPCFRVRRSSDNTEKDIYFNGEKLDEASVVSFVGSSVAYVRTWYDQSGNGRNLNQATTARQPAFYGEVTNAFNNRVVNNNNEYPCTVSFSSSIFRYLTTASGFLNNVAPVSIFITSGPYTFAGSNAAIFGPDTSFLTGLEILQSSTTSIPTLLRINGTAKNNSTSSVYRLFEDGTGGNRQSTSSFFITRTSTDAYRNGTRVPLTDATGITGLNFNGVYAMGRYANSNSFCMNGDVQEMIIYASDQSHNRLLIERDILSKLKNRWTQYG